MNNAGRATKSATIAPATAQGNQRPVRVPSGLVTGVSMVARKLRLSGIVATRLTKCSTKKTRAVVSDPANAAPAGLANVTMA